VILLEQMALERRVQYWTIMGAAFVAGTGFGIGVNPAVGVGVFALVIAYSTIRAANR
jgi:hypothetical protein